MSISWIILLIIICFLAFSYYKRYSLRARLIFLGALFIAALILMLPIFGFSIFTLLGAFLIERIWILFAAVFFIETIIEKKGRILKIIIGVVCLAFYLYLRTFI